MGVTVLKRFPTNGKRIRVEKQSPKSKFIMNRKTGQLAGRLGEGESLTQEEQKKFISRPDNTQVRRVKEDFSVKIKSSKRARGHVRHYEPGQIVGRE